ncbi:MAG: 3-hydroxyacyl-CoA dehydrogenase/enoyl-CoA hydratase family protein [Myxococcales bacterium]|nr:3-hydroxyacyl-CoA dehydrogenase/enoyl-CoA hydratase family protein [Myxococcales bacterium]
MTKGLPIRRAAVLGAGVMGRGIAAHLAGVGIDVLLLDIVPPGETSTDPAARNKFAAGGLQIAIKGKPALFFDAKADARYVTIGNFEDDLAKVGEVDWIVEVVKEDLDIKRALFTKLDALRKPGTLISSNTSGLPLADLIEGRSEDFQRNFIITHFFNPVRYMKLLEVVSGPKTDETLIPRFTAFARDTLGKGVVFAKDSPAFVANRIGTFSMMYSVHRMLEHGYPPEMLDTIFGPALGRPKTGIFKLADLVGLDVLTSVSTHLYEDLPNDEMRQYFKVPEVFQTLIDNGWLGRKSGQGFYKKVGADIQAFDPYKGDYRPRESPRYKSIGAARNIEDAGARIKKLITADDEAARLAWDSLAQMLCYSARHLDELAFDLVQVDNGVKWGFAWDLGPFEVWDAIGVPESVERMKAEGYDVPKWVTDMLAAGRTAFYEGAAGERQFWNHHTKAAAAEVVNPRFRKLPTSITHPSLVEKNHGARLWDIGDGVACVEFRTKMNAVDADIVGMLNAAVKRAETDFDALVIGNDDARAFSAGANIMMIMMGAQQKQWEQIREQIAAFQSACLGLRNARVPVVAAPFGLTLGGGAEICLGSDAIQANAELYMGLVEVGVGLIPGGGGCFGLLHNHQANGPDIDPIVYLREVFMAIGMAKVSTSAREAQGLGFLRPSDRITLDRDALLEAAKQRALGMARSDYAPPRARSLKVAGRDGYATLHNAIWGMQQAHQISAHDALIGQKLAFVLSGGDVAPGTEVTEARFHELEQEAFLSLCGEEKSIARIQYMLMNNKPLRN